MMPPRPRRFPVSLVLLFLLSGLQPAAAADGPVNNRDAACLRVLSYNIYSMSGPVPDDIIIKALKDLDADLIGLQEVYAVRGLPRLFFDDARGILERALRKAGYRTWWSSYAGASAALKPYLDPWLVYEPGNLLAVREDRFRVVVQPSEAQLSYISRALGLGRENRVVQHIGLHWPDQDGRIDFYNTHLSNRGRRSDSEGPRVEEVREVQKVMVRRRRDGASIILAGDINLTPGTSGYRLLIDGNQSSPALVDTWAVANPEAKTRPATLDPENTFFSRYSFLEKLTGEKVGPPHLPLDYVLLGPADTTPLYVRSSEVVLDQRFEGSNYSDHYGVLSELCVRPENNRASAFP